MRTLIRGLLCLALICLNSIAWAAGGNHDENYHGRNLFPKKQAQRDLVERLPKVTYLEPKALSKVSGSEVTLKWQAVEKADSYRIQVATDPNFKWIVVNEDFFKGTSYDLKNLEPGKHYFWRVYAWKTDNDPAYMSSFADFLSFETK